MPIESMEAWSMLGGALLMHLVSLGLGESFAAVEWTNPAALAALLYLALGASALGFLVYFRLLDLLGPIEINLVSYVAPVFAALSAWAFLDEWPSWTTAAGFVLIFAGFLFIKWRAIRDELPAVRGGMRGLLSRE
jgi:drug/metabolite transporter (DMT)-like permease